MKEEISKNEVKELLKSPEEESGQALIIEAISGIGAAVKIGELSEKEHSIIESISDLVDCYPFIIKRPKQAHRTWDRDYVYDLVDLIAEYNLIQEKKSYLRASARKLIEARIDNLIKQGILILKKAQYGR